MSNFQETNNMQEIMELVKLLRQNGDKVLSASSKLSLSTTLLYNMNELFSLIVDEPKDLESSFQVCSSSKIDVFRDLEFLHDFVQKTVRLKVTYSISNPNVPVDITKFRHLKYLELKKISIELVKGLQGVRDQLESIICTGRKGVCTVSQLLATYGGDAGVGFVWGSLRHLALPHNAIEQLDTSLELVPWLQIIDLNHNLLATADELSCLPNLKYVNLGYNRLEAVPIFNTIALHCLQVLVLKNNYIENINGLQGLECLTELDLSYNCLTDHSALWPLDKMSALLWISLEGNPLSYHPKHRLLSIKYLHPCLSDSKFVLDHLPLSKSEKQIVSENRFFTIRSEQSTSKELLTSFSSSFNSNNLSTSINTSTFSEYATKERSTELINNVERNVFKVKKKANVKEAIIAENELEKKELKTEFAVYSASCLETSKDHLETKKQIVALREKFGEDNWLISEGGSYVQDIMGLQSLSCPTSTSTPSKTLDNALLCTSDVTSSAENTQVCEDNSECSGKEIATDTKEIDESTASLKDEENTENMPVNEISGALIDGPTEPLYDPEEETGDLYLVQKKKNENELEELFLIITPDDIIERDAVTGIVKYRWSTNSVLSCILGRSELITVDIIFDTMREYRQNRRYFAEPDDAKKIVKTVGERMKNRPILLKVFKCMKCSTHFSDDAEYATVTITSISGTKQLKCPTCESTLVIQTDELSTCDLESDSTERSAEFPVTKDKSSDATTKSNLQHSESFSSIGGTEGGAISVTTSLVHSDSHTQAQACCSATSLEESRESTISTNTLNRRYESDIEILSSNPSQSSIEVLEEASRTQLTPHRKHSSEERRTAIAPSLLTIPDTSPIMTGLAESSSSEQFGTIIEDDDDTNVDSEKELSLEQKLEVAIIKKTSTNQNTIQKSVIFKTIGQEIDLFENVGPRGKYLEKVYRALLTVPSTTVDAEGAFSTAGSLTDSICTAYENKVIKQTNMSEKSQYNNSEKETKFTPVTNLTSMLGGLLQSIKIGNNKALILKTEDVSNFLGSNIQYCYTDFSSIDHRIKLHIILNVFEYENEELVLLLRADILMHSLKHPYPGCLVLSTSKVYILKIDGSEGEDPQRWLHKEVSWTMDRLRSFAPLPFKQGVLIELEQPNKMNEEHSTITILCILQDFQRTSNFLFYITDLSLPPSCEVECSVPEHCTVLLHRSLASSKNYQERDGVRLLALFSSAVLKYRDVSFQLKLSSLIVTASVLMVLEDNVQWLLPGNNEIPSIAREQVMSNLIGIEHSGASLTLNFLDEIVGLEESWVLEFVSVSAAETVINSVRPPWEELFSIPLQVTICKTERDAENV